MEWTGLVEYWSGLLDCTTCDYCDNFVVICIFKLIQKLTLVGLSETLNLGT